jgi:hypothetical protein
VGFFVCGNISSGYKTSLGYLIFFHNIGHNQESNMKRIFIFSVLLSGLCATTINIPSDYTTIQEGINASVDGDTVLIEQGTYYENLILEKEIVLASHCHG